MTLRVALLGSYTLDLLPDNLKPELAQAGLPAETYVGGFAQYRQDILTSDSAYARFQPDVTLLAVDFGDLFGDVARAPLQFSPAQRQAQVRAQIADLSSLIAAVKKGFPASSVLVTNVFAPPSALGLLEGNSDFSLKDVARDFNRQLEAVAKAHPSVYVIDCESLMSTMGYENWTDDRLRYLAKMPFGARAMKAFAHQIVLFIRAIKGQARKVLVLDLDNTLWGGVIGEDGLDNIQLGPDGFGAAYVEFQQEILTLSAQGVLLAISSKNNRADVMEALEKHPSMVLRADRFSAMKVDWRDKVTHLKEIAAELNVGLDSLVFVDDNPVECDLVGTQLPQVMTIALPEEDPGRFRALLREAGAFLKLTVTTEDKDRPRFYKEQTERDVARQTAGSLEDFYASLQMRAVIRPVDSFSLPRLAQLTQKTNQFNLTARRYSEADLTKMSQGKTHWVYSLQLTDKFGDNGIVGAAVLEKAGAETAKVDSFLLSCRVLGRTVEDSFLGFVMSEAKKNGFKKIIAEYKPTEKNDQVNDFYPRRGFSAGASEQEWTFDLSQGKIPSSPWIKVNGAAS